MSTLADEHAVGLLPILAMGARVVDQELLVQRAVKLRATLDAADAATTWITDPTLLAERVHRGLERAIAEVERLGLEWRYGLPRTYVLRSQTEVYRQPVEGAFRDLGSVLLIAARAGCGENDCTYESNVVDGIKAGEVVTELERIGVPCGGMLIRNASAHADIEITDTGVVATERRIKNGRASTTTVTLTDAEFAEELIALQEIMLALQLTVLPWAWGHQDGKVVVAMTSIAPTAAQRDRTLAVLAGMAGLHGLAVSVEGDQATITAARHTDDTRRREMGILSLVPVAFEATPELNRVVLRIAGLRPVMFERAEFEALAAGGLPHQLVLHGLVTARWLLESGSQLTDHDEATYVAFALTQLHFDCAKLVGNMPQRDEDIDQAVDSLRLSLARLDEVLPTERRNSLTSRAVEQATSPDGR